MTARPRVLIVATVELAQDVVGALVGADAQTLVVVPTVRQSKLQWLANDDDRARETAQRASERLAAETPGATVDARAGDPDPVLAVEDALREFPADEILVVTRPQDDAGWLEERLAQATPGTIGGVQVRQVLLAPDGTVEVSTGGPRGAA